MSLSRRSLLFGSGVAIAALSGCQGLGIGTQPHIGVELTNYTDRAQPLKLTLIREGNSDGSEAEVLDKQYTVPAPDGDDPAGTRRESNIVPKHPYLVRVLPKYSDFRRFHAHYYPETSSADRLRISIRREDTTEDLYVDFRGL